MNKLATLFAILISLMIFSGCKKEIDIDYKVIEPILVIEGNLTQEGPRVRLTLTTPMNEPMDRTPLTDARILLKDITDCKEESLYVDGNGDFIGTTPGIPGHSYTLTILRENKTYTASCEMPYPVKISGLEFNWIKMPYDHVAVLKVSFRDISTEPGECYWVRLYRNGEAYMWNLMTDVYSEDGTINDVFMTSRKDLDEEEEDTILRDGDVVTATVCAISREMYDYLEAISSDSNGPQMFSGDFCLGYFLASPVVKESITFHPDEIPVY